MGNKVARILFGIIIAVGVLVGGYFILPGKVHYPIKQFIQSKTNDNYEKVIEPLKKAPIPKNKKATFGDSFEKKTDNTAWTIEDSEVDDKGNGSYTIFADGYNVTVSLEGDDTDSLITHTNAHFRCTFVVEKQGTEIKVNGKKLEEGKPIYPSLVEIDQDSYSVTNTTNDYYQQCLNFLANHGE